MTLLISLIWPLAAVFAALTGSIFYIVGQIYKLPGHYIVLWSRVMVLIISLPVLFILEPPTDPRFYLAVAATGILVGLSDTQIFNIAKEYGGGVIARILPLQITIIFFMWLIIRPDMISDYLARPAHSFLIFLALCGCVFFAANMRKSKVSAGALKKSIFPLISQSVVFVLAKYAFDHAPLHSGVYYYILVQTLALMPFMFLYGLFSKNDVYRINRTDLLSKAMFWPAFWVFIGWILHMFGKNYANALAPNPAYVAALVMTTPVWMIIIYKMFNLQEKGDIKSGVALLLCAMLLTILSAL